MRFLPTVLFLISITLLAADNPFLGTWKLNTAKSKSSSSSMPVPQSLTVKFEADGDKVRRSVSGVNGQGKPVMQGGPEGVSMAWDGKDHPVATQDSTPVTVAVKRINDYRNDVTVKRNGKVIADIRSVISKDGKTMTNTSDGVDEKVGENRSRGGGPRETTLISLDSRGGSSPHPDIFALSIMYCQYLPFWAARPPPCCSLAPYAFFRYASPRKRN